MKFPDKDDDYDDDADDGFHGPSTSKEPPEAGPAETASSEAEFSNGKPSPCALTGMPTSSTLRSAGYRRSS